MYGRSGFAEKLKFKNCENSTENCWHYICTEGLDLQKNWISRTAKIQCENVYIIYLRNVLICRKFDYPELRIFNWKVCTLYMYEMSGFAKKLNFQNRVNWTGNCIHNMYGMSGFAVNLNIQNCENSTRNCVNYIFTKRLDLLKNWTSRTAKIHRDIVYIIYVQNVNISWKIEYSELQKFNGKLCKLYMYGMFGLAKKLNVQSWENATENCVCYIFTECLD